MQAIAAAFLFVCLAAFGEDTPVAPEPLTATGLVGGPLIDGKLDDDAWKSVPWTKTFQAIKGGRLPKSPGRAKIAWDFRHLYLAFETQDAEINAKKRDRDGPMWEDDAFEIFLDAAGRGDHYIEIGINAENCYYDYLVIPRSPAIGPGHFPEITLNGLVTQTGRLEGGGWTAEVAIPWRCIKSAPALPPRKGDAWRINLLQVDRDAGGRTAAATLSPIEHTHDPAHFVLLKFDGAALDAEIAAAHAEAEKVLAANVERKVAWRLGEHLADVEVVSSRLGKLPFADGGYLAPVGFGRAAPRKPVEGEEPPKVPALVTVHSTDTEQSADTLWLHLPPLKTEKLLFWYRIDPTKEKGLASGKGDGVGLGLEIREDGDDGKPRWRRLMDAHAADTKWSLRQLAVPPNAALRIAIDRGPATAGYDMCEIGVEAE
jgi:hypothetical protein